MEKKHKTGNKVKIEISLDSDIIEKLETILNEMKSRPSPNFKGSSIEDLVAHLITTHVNSLTQMNNIFNKMFKDSGIDPNDPNNIDDLLKNIKKSFKSFTKEFEDDNDEETENKNNKVKN